MIRTKNTKNKKVYFNTGYNSDIYIVVNFKIPDKVVKIKSRI